jgi:hypothetical protein
MDPLSVTSAAIGLVGQSLKVSNALEKLLGGVKDSRDMVGELSIYAGILEGLSRDLLTTPALSPTLAATCSRLCHYRLSRVTEIVERKRVKKTFTLTKELSEVLHGFFRAVKIFRDIAME